MLLVVLANKRAMVKEKFFKQALNFPVSASLSAPRKIHHYISKQSDRRRCKQFVSTAKNSHFFLPNLPFVNNFKVICSRSFVPQISPDEITSLASCPV